MSISGNVNYFKKVVRHECTGNAPMIYAEAAFEALTPLLFVPFTFSCSDWVKAPLGISWKCGRKIEALAKHVWGPEIVDGTKLFYTLSGMEAIYGAAYVWFIADLAVNTYANFTSLLYLHSGCDLPPNGHVTCGLDSIYIDAGGEGQVFLDTRQDKQCVFVGGNVIQFSAGCYGAISYSFQALQFGGDTRAGDVTVWVEDSQGRKYDPTLSGNDASKPHQFSMSGLNYLNQNPGSGQSYVLKYRVNRGTAKVGGGTLNATGYGKPNPLIPAGCFSNFFSGA